MKLSIQLNLIIFAIFLLSSCTKKKISLSFDDAPTKNSIYMDGDKRTNLLINNLKKSGVKRAAFYTNTSYIYTHNGLERLKKYQKAGHLIGNHTHSHLKLKSFGKDAFLKDIDYADKILKENNLLEKYFRYPYLYHGKDLKEVNAVRKHFIKKGYVDAYVTVDNYDWYINSLFIDSFAKNLKIDMNKMKDFYVDTIYQSVVFYDELALKALGKQVNHVLLLHENDMAALFIGDLVKKLEDNGWEITTPEESYTDKVLNEFPSQVLNQGRGRINSLAQKKKYMGRSSSKLQDKDYLKKLFEKYKVVEKK